MQSSYSAAMGSVLCTMLWKTSKSEDVINTYIETGTLSQFLNLANTTLKSFRETYEGQLPIPETFEFKFIISLFGIAVNILAQRIGRNYVLERESGVEFIKSTLQYLGEIEMPDGQLLKRLILMMIYNVSITNRGALLIEVCENSIESILKCFNSLHTVEIQSVALSIMTSLLNELPTPEFCENVIKKVSLFLNNFSLN